MAVKQNAIGNCASAPCRGALWARLRMGVVPSRARKQAVVAQTIASPCLTAAGSRGHPTAAGDKMESYSTPSRGSAACPRARNWPILKRIPMSEPYLGLLIGAAPDLPPLFEI